MAFEKDRIEKIECDKELVPFVRNRYFYGKLLTVRDFENEQGYFVKKRRLLNRYLHGEGVVCGLLVEKVAESETPKVKIAPGIALDCCGREIVVPEEVVVDLSDRREGNYWIGLRYTECGREPVAAAVEANACAEKCCFSRVEERYAVEILEEPPAGCGSFDAEKLCEAWKEMGSGESAGGESVSREAERFVGLYQGSCTPGMEERPVLLARIALSAEDGAVSVDNALLKKGDIGKKVVHTGERLFGLLKCISEERKVFAKITKTNWRHDATFRVEMVDKGVVKKASQNALAISSEFETSGPIEPGMYLYLKRENGDYRERKRIESFDPRKSLLKVESGWPELPGSGERYWVLDDESDAFFTRLEKSEITFSEKMDDTTVDAKTLTCRLEGFGKAGSGEDTVEMEIAERKLPLRMKWKDRNEVLEFGLPEGMSESIMPVFRETAKRVYALAPSAGGLATHPAAAGWVEMKRLFFGLRSRIRVAGDFLFSEKGRPLDANHIGGRLPTGNGTAGGLFESWYGLEYDWEAYNVVVEYLKWMAGNRREGLLVSDMVKRLEGTRRIVPFLLEAMKENHLLYEEKGRYHPLPDPRKTMVVYDTKVRYLKAEAEKLAEKLAEKGVSVVVKSVGELTEEDRATHELLFVRGSSLSSHASSILEGTGSAIGWEASSGDTEIVRPAGPAAGPLFILGGNGKEAVEKAVADFVKRYHTPR